MIVFRQLSAGDWSDYCLLDSGDGRKLERFGDVCLDRPDAQAVWSPLRPHRQWRADAVFHSSGADERGGWSFPHGPVPENWSIGWEQLRFQIACHSFRHVGLFPEHSVHWRWAEQQLAVAGNKRPARILNMFGYSGAMSLAMARAGAELLHLDASRKAIAIGMENQQICGLGDRPVRWICDDALKFMRREVRRKRQYDAIILDPPKYGRGPKNEVWQLEQDLFELLGLVRELLSERPLFVILTVYAMRLSGLAIAQALQQALDGRGGTMEWGEMSIPEQDRELLLPTSVYARWSA